MLYLLFFQGKWSSDSLPCGKPSKDLKVMVILPSTMYFTMLLNFDLSHIVIKKGFLNRVCYSFHSSYTEVKDLVTYLQPDFVRPNVKPAQDATIMKVDIINSIYLIILNTQGDILDVFKNSKKVTGNTTVTQRKEK